MTTIRRIEQKCPVCGKSSPQPVLSSTSTWGYPDLDLRPAEMQRSSMFTWVLECPHCGYVSERMENETDITEEFLKSDEYMNCNGLEFKSDLARRFYRAYLIAEKSDDARRCFFNLLHCAWKCDDAQDSNATEIRKLALSYIDGFNHSEMEKENFPLMKADILRRSGQFDRVVEEFENMKMGKQRLDQIIHFQIEKAREKDTACYTVEDVISR